MSSPVPPFNSIPPRQPVELQSLEERFAQRLEALRARLAQADPAQVARACGAQHTPDDAGGAVASRLTLALWERPIRIECPGWIAFPANGDQPLPAFDQALLLYYLTTADGAPLRREWIAFSDLPDGRFYNQAFQGYTGQELARAFRDDRAAFERAAQALSGARHPLGDAAYAFQALPRAPLLAVYWQGDEDFPSTCQVLFDAAASHYLPTDAYAILGSSLTRRLIRKKE